MPMIRDGCPFSWQGQLLPLLRLVRCPLQQMWLLDILVADSFEDHDLAFPACRNDF